MKICSTFSLHTFLLLFDVNILVVTNRIAMTVMTKFWFITLTELMVKKRVAYELVDDPS
jgi:hypothetical protein